MHVCWCISRSERSMVSSIPNLEHSIQFSTMEEHVLPNPARPWSSNQLPLDAVIAAANKQSYAPVRVKNLGSDPPSSEHDLEQLLTAGQHRSIARGSVYLQETAENLRQMERRLGIKSFRHYRDIGVHACNLMISTTVSAEIMASIASYIALLFLVDDLCFDVDDMPAAYHGVADCRDQEQAQKVLSRWCDALGSLEPPPDQGHHHDLLYPILMATWEAGRDMRRFSSAHPDWYPAFLDSVHDYASSCLEMRADMGSADRELESYARQRARNSAGLSTCVLLELGNQCFLPPHLRLHPGIHKLTWAATMHIAFVNDIYSYDKEVVHAGDQFHHNFHLMAVLMREEGLSPEQALQRAVEVTNSYTRVFTTAEAELPTWDSSPAEDSVVRRHVLALKEIMSGNMHLHAAVTERGYRWPSFIV